MSSDLQICRAISQKRIQPFVVRRALGATRLPASDARRRDRISGRDPATTYSYK
jgi:hypothetical protein